jgi:hypothetical protein
VRVKTRRQGGEVGLPNMEGFLGLMGVLRKDLKGLIDALLMLHIVL